MEIVKMFKKDTDERMLATKMSDFLNTLTPDYEGFINEIQKDQEGKEIFTKVCIGWLKMLHIQKEQDKYDARNEYSVILGDKLYNKYSREIEYFISDIKYDEFSVFDFVDEMSRKHRTLQQAFSELVFRFLYCTKDINIELVKKIVEDALKEDEKFYRTPFI